jgi:hypothetical protein
MAQRSFSLGRPSSSSSLQPAYHVVGQSPGFDPVDVGPQRRCTPALSLRWLTLLYWSAVALCALTELTHTATVAAAPDWFLFALGGFLCAFLALLIAGLKHLPCCTRAGDYEHEHHGLAVQWYLILALTLLPTVLLAEFAWHYPTDVMDAWRCCRWDAVRPPQLDLTVLMHWHSLMTLTLLTWLLMGASFFLVHLRLPARSNV